MIIQKNVVDFINKFKLPLLQYLLKDKDVDLSLKLKQQTLKCIPIEFYTNRINFLARKLISIDELEQFLSSQDYRNQYRFFDEKYIYTENEIDYIYNKQKCLRVASCFQGVIWSEGLINKYKDQWDWFELSSNNSVHWDLALIKTFETYVDFVALSYNVNLNLNEELFLKYINKWDFNALSGNPAIKNIESLFLNSENAIWTNKPTIGNYNGINQELIDLNRIYYVNNLRSNSWSIKPSISSNSRLFWNVTKFKKFKNKIDVWLIALFGNLDSEVIKEFADELNVNRIVDTEFTQYSDWRDKHPIHCNGWENWLKNKFTTVDCELLVFLSKKDVTLINYSGDARTGHSVVETQKKVTEIIPPSKISITIEELSVHYNLISTDLINEKFIHKDLYTNIIRPAFLQNESLVKGLIERI